MMHHKLPTANIEAGSPTAPKDLDEIAKAEYKRVASLLSKANSLTPADRTALELYARLYSRWLKAEAELLKNGSIVENSANDIPFVSPWYKVASATAKQLAEALDRLGLSPTKRSKINPIAKPETKSPMSEFIKMKTQ